MKKKYVITSNGLPILFDEALIHRTVSMNYFVDSAGFCSFSIDEKDKRITVKCWGGSTSLHISSKPDADQKIIEALLND
jgi:hypothetical protein